MGRRFLPAFAAVLVLIAALPAGHTIAGAVRASPRPEGLELSLLATPGSGPAPLTVAFAATLNDPTDLGNFTWQFGDGTGFVGAARGVDTLSHEYLSPGEFFVVASFSGSGGAAASTTVVTVGPAPLSASIDAAPTVGAPPLTVAFAAHLQGGTGTYSSLNWSFGNGENGSGLHLNYTYSTPGSYLVALSVTDSSGQSATASLLVQVLAQDAPTGALGDTEIEELSALAASALAVAAIWLLLRNRSGGPVSARDGPSPPDGAVQEPVPSSPIPSTPGAAPGPGASDNARQAYERILVHLYWRGRRGPGGVASVESTRDGIARGIGVDPSTVSRALRKLTDGGAVLRAQEHVPGLPRRVATFTLTPSGNSAARALAHRAPEPKGTVAPSNDGDGA